MILASLLTAAAATSNLAASEKAGCSVRREPVVLRLGDFDSPAELERPPAGVRTRGVAVLFAGSDVADLDGAVVGPDDRIVSRPLRQVADRIACAGFASVRYNKRYVTGAATVDRVRFDRLDGSDLAADGRTAVAFARSRPDLAGLPVVLVGWSQGTTVAMAVGAAEPAVEAVVLMAPVMTSPARNAQAHYARVGRPYLQRYATGGSLDASAIARAGAGPGGSLAQVFVRMFRGFAPGERVNPMLDADGDGRISFAEADPVLASWYADTPDGGLGMDATGRALKGVADAYVASSPPILLVQGLNDGNVDPQAARAFAAPFRSGGRVTLLTYSGLGHSLGRAGSVLEDKLGPMAAEPLDDIARWLTRRMPR